MLTMMHLCIMLYTYWTPLFTSYLTAIHHVTTLQTHISG